jgi:hypothetical protein
VVARVLCRRCNSQCQLHHTPETTNSSVWSRKPCEANWTLLMTIIKMCLSLTETEREREREREPKASEESGQTWSTLWITHGTASHSGRPFCRKWSRRRIYIVLIVSASRVSRLFGASGASFNLSSATCKINSSTEAEDGVIERRDRVPRLASTGIPTAKPCEQRWPVLDGELFSEP